VLRSFQSGQAARAGVTSATRRTLLRVTTHDRTHADSRILRQAAWDGLLAPAGTPAESSPSSMDGQCRACKAAEHRKRRLDLVVGDPLGGAPQENSPRHHIRTSRRFLGPDRKAIKPEARLIESAGPADVQRKKGYNGTPAAPLTCEALMRLQSSLFATLLTLPCLRTRQCRRDQIMCATGSWTVLTRGQARTSRVLRGHTVKFSGRYSQRMSFGEVKAGEAFDLRSRSRPDRRPGQGRTLIPPTRADISVRASASR